MPPSKRRRSPERQEPRSSGRSVPNSPAPKKLTPTKPVTLLHGDVLTQLQRLPTDSIHCCITSPPYWGLRDYNTGKWRGGDPKCDHKQGRSGSGRANGVVDPRSQRNRDGVEALTRQVCARCGAVRKDKQLGLERTPEEYVRRMTAVFSEVRRVLRQDGTLWLVIGDSYASGATGSNGRSSSLEGGQRTQIEGGRRPEKDYGLIKFKDLVGIPWILAFALRADGWYLRQDIIWSKTNPMPESVTDRCCKSHEHVFLLTKSKHYYFDHEAIKEPCVGPAPAGNKKRVTARERGCPNEGTGSSVPWAGGESRTKRDVWRISTQPYKEVHFATFPEELVTLALLAGVSAKRCEQCGAPWVRVRRHAAVNPNSYKGSTFSKGKTVSTHKGVQPGSRTTSITTDCWKCNCKCPRTQGTGPATVLDPFCGSGTVGAVARRYGLSFIGIDLNPEYLRMARRRISKAEAAR